MTVNNSLIKPHIHVNPCPAEPWYTLSLQTVHIQISWLLKKPTDLDLHCLPCSMWIYNNNPDQVIWLVKNQKWAWHLTLFSRTRVNTNNDIWAAPCKKHVFGHMRQRRLWWTCASIQSDQDLQCPLTESLCTEGHNTVYQFLIRLYISVGWSGSFLLAFTQRHLFLCWSS